MHRRVDGRTGVDGAGDVELDHLLPQRIPPFIAQRWCEGLAASGLIGVDIAGDKSLLFDTALQFFRPALGLTPGDWGSWHTGETLSGKRRPMRAIRSLQASCPVAADQFRAKVMPHG